MAGRAWEWAGKKMLLYWSHDPERSIDAFSHPTHKVVGKNQVPKSWPRKATEKASTVSHGVHTMTVQHFPSYSPTILSEPTDYQS